MADNGYDGERQTPFPLTDRGKGYQKAVKSRAQAILNSLMGYLPSNYRAEIASTEYSYYLRAMSTELAKLTVSLEDMSSDISFEQVRSEFLYQVVGYFIFIDDDLPDIDLDDEEFRNLLLKIIDIFFQGSTPESIEEAVELFTNQDFVVREAFKEARQSDSPRDIADQFEFTVEFDLDGEFPEDAIRVQENIQLLIDIVKPAHTLYGISHVFSDVFKPGDDEVEEDLTWEMHDRRYEDARKYCQGMAGFESSSGYANQGSLHVLRDDADDAPLGSVAKGATLTIPNGENTGLYRVTEVYDDNSLRVKPRLSEPETGLSYHVEVDRMGSKEEVYVEEDKSDEFVSALNLEIDLNGPYSVYQNSDVTIKADANTSQDVTYNWDLDGDGDFNDATGDEVTYQAGSGPDTRLVVVRAEAEDGRTAGAEATINIIT